MECTQAEAFEQYIRDLRVVRSISRPSFPEGKAPAAVLEKIQTNALRCNTLMRQNEALLAQFVYDRDPAAALDYLNRVVTARGLLPREAGDIDTPGKFRDELINEITKEYWGEGQIFFTNKRFWLAMEGVNGKRHAASDETYVLPLPESENSEGIN